MVPRAVMYGWLYKRRREQGSWYYSAMQQEVDSRLRLLTQFKGENGIGYLGKTCRDRKNE